MVDLSELSIIIPFQYDSEDRLQNLETILRYFSMHFKNTDVHIIEGGKSSHSARLQAPNITYTYVGTTSYFHKTAYLNIGAKQSKRPYLAFYDTDVICKPTGFIEALNHIKNPTTPFAFPHNGVFLNIKNPTKQHFIDQFNFNALPSFIPTKVGETQNHVECIHLKSPGGATCFNRQFFLQTGGYNEKFISWGWEDDEIVTRFTKLGFPPIRTSTPCYHLHHKRGPNSSNTHVHFKQNFKEFKHVYSLTPAEVGTYIQTQLSGQLPQHVLDRLPKNSWLSPLQKVWWKCRV
jgi:predicted glycosyltransferase involved in capsule biosynthesis